MGIDAQMSMLDDNAEYNAFVDKFKRKKTTDDCYTPENIYDVVRDWVFDKYKLPADTRVVRPFWPDTDYLRYEYPKDCIVIDNPPFSIISKIVRHYMASGVRFFLFAPALTLFTASDSGANYIVTNVRITYANGAMVNTSFITNMGDYKIETAPDLHEKIKIANDKNRKGKTKKVQKFSYPPEVITSGTLGRLSVYDTYLRIRSEDCIYVKKLDVLTEKGTAPFGGAFILSSNAAAERAAAERAAATMIHLSDREREIQKQIGR